MFKKPSKLLAALSLGTALLWGAAPKASAQCGFLPTDGCPGTNYNNYGVASSGAATLEYDNFVSAFYATMARDYAGNYRIWGQSAAADGSSLSVPTIINPINFPGLTGRILKVATASSTGFLSQFIVLTTDGLFAWGSPGSVLSSSIAPSTAVQKVTVNGQATGLPAGVSPAQVKMLFATYQTLALVTCSGEAYVLTAYTLNGSPRGDGGTGDTDWARVQDASTEAPLTGVVAIRGAAARLMALKNDGTVYTWGQGVYLGNGVTTSSLLIRATQMVLPSGESGPIKMIGMTGNSHYILYENGHLYALGFNSNRQLGDFTNTVRGNWVQPRYTSAAGPVMNDIVWISPAEHAPDQAINVINSAYQLYSWGRNVTGSIGRTVNNNLDPAMAAGILSTDKILSVETSGRTSMLAKACTQNFGFSGDGRFGLLGNGTETNPDQIGYTFATGDLQLCGATTVPQIFVNGSATIDALARYCNSTSVVLSALPAGGTWSVVSGPATLAGNRLSFTGTGNDVVTISYTATTVDCGSSTATKTFNVGDCKMNSVSGTIWNDANGNASLDGAEAGIDNDLWVNLVGPDGNVAGSAKVASDGTYAIALLTQNTQAGNYTLIITNGEKQPGTPLAASDAPNADYGYTGTSVGGVANTGNRSGIIDIGALAGAVTAVNFGISNDPAVLPVKFGFVAAELFNNQLLVKWNTTSELNNSHFEIEASADGTNFISIGKVDSKATNGISADALEYEFTKDASAGVVAAGIALLAAGAGLFKARRTRYAMLAVTLGMIVLAAGCNKNRRDVLPEGKLYVRVAQVDKDGTRSYSKAVAVVKR